MKTRGLLKYFPLLAFLTMRNQSVPTPREIGGFKGNPEFHPKRTKLKGWMKENRKSTFNKNR